MIAAEDPSLDRLFGDSRLSRRQGVALTARVVTTPQ